LPSWLWRNGDIGWHEWMRQKIGTRVYAIVRDPGGLSQEWLRPSGGPPYWYWTGRLRKCWGELSRARPRQTPTVPR